MKKSDKMRKLAIELANKKEEKKEYKKVEKKVEKEIKYDADVNKDGKVDKADIEMIEKVIKKKKKD